MPKWVIHFAGQEWSEDSLTLGEAAEIEEAIGRGATWRQIHPMNSARVCLAILKVLGRRRVGLTAEALDRMVDDLSIDNDILDKIVRYVDDPPTEEGQEPSSEDASDTTTETGKAAEPESSETDPTPITAI